MNNLYRWVKLDGEWIPAEYCCTKGSNDLYIPCGYDFHTEVEEVGEEIVMKGTVAPGETIKGHRQGYS